MKKLLVVLLVLCFAAPVVAADWHFYGSMRTHLGYYDVDQEYAGGPAMDGTIGTGWDDDDGTLLDLAGQARLGAKVIASEDLYGVIEFGFRDSTRDNANNDDPYFRLGYGVWNFGAGKLLVGKDYTPGTYLGYSRMGGDLGDNGDANMLVAGLPYIGRQPQIKVSFGDLDFALIEQHKDAYDYSAESAALGGGATDIDFVLPRIEASYVFRTELVNIRPVVGYQSYEVETQFAGDEDVDSYLLGIGASFDLKPAYIKATASYIQNSGNYGQSNIGVVAPVRNAAIGADGDLNDSDLYQATLVAGMQVNKMLNLEAGFAYMKGELDESIVNGIPAKDLEQTAYVYYLQAWLSMAKGMYIIPEIGVVDRDDFEFDVDIPGGPSQKIDMGKMTYFDVNFRVDF